MIDNSLDKVTGKPEIRRKINETENVYKGAIGQLMERITKFLSEKI